VKIFPELLGQIERLSDILGVDADAADLPAAMARLDDEAVVEVIAAASALVKAADPMLIAAAGVAAQRSARDRGHSGLAQVRGHRSPESLIQHLTGSTRADAAKHVRLGESLIAAIEPAQTDPDTADAPVGDSAPAVVPWHHVLGDALLGGRITPSQHDAILRGLGEPPTPDSNATDESERAAEIAAQSATIRAAWQAAAEQLIDEAGDRTVEDLRRDARICRDLLDEAGAARRFEQRYEARSFRMWTDENGIRHAHIVFDDLGGEWATTVVSSALRPRRGGPRFVDPDEAAAAKQLADDPRTNDQLTYDLIMATLRAGALADAKTVFGARQPGIRLVVTRETAAGERDALGRLPGVGFTEDGRQPLPGSVIDAMHCDTGHIEATFDERGNPLDLGREQRLYSPKQRLTLALRDGGCVWGDCTMPASYCEVHHCIHWGADHGRTDIDLGLLLCQFHHLHLHNEGWRITREGKGQFLLHPPPDVGGPPIVLRSKSPLQFFRLLAPPERAAKDNASDNPSDRAAESAA